MKWHDQAEHPEPLTDCICEYTNAKDGTRFYAPMIAYPNGAWLTGSAIAYAQHEVTQWCPLDEIVSVLNGVKDERRF